MIKTVDVKRGGASICHGSVARNSGSVRRRGGKVPPRKKEKGGLRRGEQP